MSAVKFNASTATTPVVMRIGVWFWFADVAHPDGAPAILGVQAKVEISIKIVVSNESIISVVST